MPSGGALAAIYLQAIRAAAAREGAIDAVTVRAVEQDLEAFAAALATGIEQLPAARQAARRRAASIVQVAAEALDRALITQIGGARQLVFRDTFRIMARAQLAAADALDIPLGTFGAIPIPRLGDAHAFAAVAELYDYRTLVRGHVLAGAKDALAVIRAGIVQSTPPDAIARALRPYIVGAAEIPGGVADLRRVPAEYRGAAKELAYNAKRIAYSETHAARMLSQAVRMRDDPFVIGGKWHTAPNRGKVRIPDICDVLRDADFFGLGAGVYPSGRIPAPPHPWDRCNVTVVPRQLRPGEDWRAPKSAPDSYRLMLDPVTADLPHLAEMTPATEARVRRDLAQLLHA